jgi:glycosyltransferase involved in cell wall biosynthesis
MKSVSGQKNVIFEYIVIDGGSTDGSMDIINKYGDCVAKKISERDNGIYHAMNKGINISTGEYLLFINSGDEFLDTNSLEKAFDHLDGTDLVSFNLMVALENSSYIKHYPYFPTFKYFLDDTLPHPATFIKRKLLQLTAGYDESLKICADWAFFLVALCKLDATHKHVDIPLSKFYFDGISSLKENRMLMFDEKKQMLIKHFARFSDLIEEWEKGETATFILKNSRLIKIAKKFGFLKGPKTVD